MDCVKAVGKSRVARWNMRLCLLLNPRPSAEGGWVGFYRQPSKVDYADNAEEGEERQMRARHCVAHLYYSFYFKLRKYNERRRKEREECSHFPT